MAVAQAIAAIVLAGGPPDEVSVLAPDVANKAFVPIAGRTLVARTIGALRACPRVGTIDVVAPAQTRGDAALAAADGFAEAGETMSASLRAGLRDRPPDELVLVAASDLPMLTTAALDEFLNLASACDADLVYACLERRYHIARFPDIPHTWARLRDGAFCGGGVVAMRPRAFARLELFLGRLGAARKNPLRLAAIFGLPTLARYALGRLTVADAERRGSTLVGIRVAAARCTQPEIALNVDRASDIAWAKLLLEAEGD